MFEVCLDAKIWVHWSIFGCYVLLMHDNLHSFMDFIYPNNDGLFKQDNKRGILLESFWRAFWRLLMNNEEHPWDFWWTVKSILETSDELCGHNFRPIWIQLNIYDTYFIYKYYGDVDWCRNKRSKKFSLEVFRLLAEFMLHQIVETSTEFLHDTRHLFRDFVHIRAYK